MKTDSTGKQWTGLEFTDATQNAPCPKCQAKPGDYCRTPKGRQTDTPHVERLIEFARLFPIYRQEGINIGRLLTLAEILKR